MICTRMFMAMAEERTAMVRGLIPSFATRHAEFGYRCRESFLHRLKRFLNVLWDNSFALSIVSLVLCGQTARAQIPETSSGKPIEQGIQIEHSQFALTQEPYTDDTPGLLWRGGCIERDVVLNQSDYVALNRKRGGAIVEVIAHSNQYPYAVKDLFGTFRSVTSRESGIPKREITVVNGTVDEGRGKWRFTVWQLPDGAPGGTMCILLREKNDIGPFEGLIGWYTRRDGAIHTVLIRFTNLRGVPAHLIDEYLKKYPSSVKESDFHGETWVADDVHKWIHLLQLHKSDKMMFEMALGHLAAYDNNFFGDRDAFLTAQAAVRAGDTATVENVIQDLKLEAEQWLQNRATKNRQKKGD